MYASRFHRIALSLVLTFALASPAWSASQSRVHVISIGDSGAGSIADKVVEDARNVVASFESSFAKAGVADRLSTRLIVGEDVTREKILAIIDAAKIGPDDALVVYFSGHGGCNSNNEHFLALGGRERLSRKELLQVMQRTQPRLAVLLTDACSSYSNGKPGAHVLPTYQPQAFSGGNAMEWATIESLFFKHRGTVDITAAEPGFRAVVDGRNSGSLFTNAMLRILHTPYSQLIASLDRDHDGYLQWDEVLPQLRAHAATADAEQHGAPIQQAYAIQLGVWIPAVADSRR